MPEYALLRGGRNCQDVPVFDGELQIPRPDCVDNEQWESLTQLRARLDHAVLNEDLALVVGSAKELCEAVAKLVWLRRGEQYGTNTSFPDLVTGAHRLVDRLPGYGTLGDGGARTVAQTAMKFVRGLGELRSRAGTGHGRPEPVELAIEDAAFSARVAILWSSWMLGRLDTLVAALPETLADNLRSNIFYKGELVSRLVDSGLPTMDVDDQRVIGIAVGQRAAGGTFNVYHEGVAPAANTLNIDEWPLAYREGVAEGLLLDRNGYLTVPPGLVGSLIELLQPLSGHGAPVIAGLAARVTETEIAYGVKKSERDDAIAALRSAAQAANDLLLQEALEALATQVEAL